jgi:hypothetical protein
MIWLTTKPPGYNGSMTTTLLDRFVDPVAECLTMDAARKVVDLRADDATQSRVDELAAKANEGTLSDLEKMEYDDYLAAFHFVTVLQARARRMLNE